MLARFLSPIPLAPEDVRMGAPVRWQLGCVEMTIPLFSLARWELFSRLVAAMPAVMIADTRVPFQYVMDLEN